MTDTPRRRDSLSRISAVVQRRVPNVFRMDSIKSQIVVFALLAALIPSIAMAWVSYVQSRGALTDKITEELRSISTQTAREMEIWLKEALYEMRVFASSYVVTESVERLRQAAERETPDDDALTRLTDYLRSVRERSTDYDELFVVAPGASVVTSGLAEVGPIQLKTDWLDEVEAGRVVVGEPYWDEHLGRAGLTLGIPIALPDGRFLGALAATVNFSTVQGILQKFVRSERGDVHLTTNDGRLILSASGSSAALMAVPLDSTARVAMQTDTAGLVSYDGMAGEQVVGTSAPILGLPWATVAELQAAEAFGPIARLRNVTLAFVIGLVLLIGLIAYRLGLLIARPLDRLTTAAGTVAKGDLSVELPDAGAGEVGYLTDVFVYMVQRLREGREKLSEAHEELKETNEELERLSITDSLTGLFNRRYLMRTLEAEVRRAGRMKHPFAVLMTDVDHFKSFNDTYGHQAGDEVLARVAGVLQATVREVDCAARYGGEEFSVMLPETDLQGAAEVAERARVGVAEEPFVFRGKAVRVTLSIGVSEFPTDGDTSEKLIEAADRALYQAKRKGRNRVVRAPRRGRPRKKEA